MPEITMRAFLHLMQRQLASEFCGGFGTRAAIDHAIKEKYGYFTQGDEISTEDLADYAQRATIDAYIAPAEWLGGIRFEDNHGICGGATLFGRVARELCRRHAARAEAEFYETIEAKNPVNHVEWGGRDGEGDEA